MTSSRYQSRLFNFFFRQSQRFGDSVGRTWRSCRVAANWSLEALVYPIFVLIQKTVNAGKKITPRKVPQQQLNSNDGNSILSNSTPECDTAIIHMLEIVKKLPSRYANSLNAVAEKLDYVKYHQQLEIDDTVKAYLPSVRGIATNLRNKHLVLVTTDNKVLDILTLKQQQKLQDRIIAEVSEYWRLCHLSSKQVKSKHLSPEIDRLLFKLTGGNTRPEVPDVGSSKEINTLSSTQAYLSSLDALVARLESILSRVSTSTQIDQYNHQNHTLQHTTNLITDIRTLCSVAINRIFDKSPTKQYGKVANKQGQLEATATLPKLRQSTDETLDAWLTFDDLFGEQQQAPRNNSSISNHYPRLLSPYKAKEQPVNWQKINQNPSLCPLGRPPRVSSLNFESVSKLFDLSTVAQNTKKSAVSQDESSIVISNRADSVTTEQGSKAQSEDKPEFVEILFKNVGYEKHILERILEWLDKLMLWLEEQFVRILKLIKQIFA